MKEVEKLSYVKALMYVSLADEQIDRNELRYIDQIASLYGLDSAQTEALKESATQRSESIDQILANIEERSTKLTLLYDLLALCYADDQYSFLEKQGLRKVCDMMNIERSKLEDLESVMEEQLNIQKKINAILER